MTCFWILNKWWGQANTCPSLCAHYYVVLLYCLNVVRGNAFKLYKTVPMEVTAGGKDLGEIHMHQDYSVSCYWLYCQTSHLNLHFKIIKKQRVRICSWPPYFQISYHRKSLCQKLKISYYFIEIYTWCVPQLSFQMFLRQWHCSIEKAGISIEEMDVELIGVEHRPLFPCSCIPPHLITEKTNI